MLRFIQRPFHNVKCLGPSPETKEHSKKKGVRVAHKLTEEENMIIAMVDSLCRDAVAPRAAAIDAEDVFPEDIYRLFSDQGLFSLAFDERYGGCKVGMHCWIKVIERIAEESPAVALMVLISAIGSDALLFKGSEVQKRAILPQLASGEAKICFALTEPHAGSDISAITSTAKPEEEGYVINGSKTFITNGEVGDYFTIFVKVLEEDQAKPACFIVHKDTPGLIIGRKEDKMGLRGSVTSQLFFENLHVQCDALIGKPGDGFAIAHHTLNRGRLAVAALACGVMAACLKSSVRYAQERKQFGKPIGDLQAIRFMLADMEISLEAGHLLLEQASSVYERNTPSMMKAASVAKVFCSEQSIKAAETAVQIFGGYGLCKDYPVERYYRDAKSFTIVEGTSQVQRELIARAIMKEY